MLSRLSLRFRIFLFFALIGVVAAAIIVGAMMMAPADYPPSETVVYGGGGAFLLLAFITGVWLLFDIYVAVPLRSLIRDLQTVVHGNTDHRIDLADAKYLGELPAAVQGLAVALAEARRETAKAAGEAAADAEERKNRLEAILRDLHEGVVICTLGHEITLYNRRAMELLRVAGEIGLGRSLFRVTNRQPFLHALERLTNRFAEGRHKDRESGLSTPFIAATSDGRYTLEGHMSLILGPNGHPNGYVITFEDNTSRLAALGQRDHLLKEATENLRRPVANLRAAIETVAANPDMETARRRRFDAVLVDESEMLSNRLEQLAAQYKKIIDGHWPMTDVYSANLLNCLVRRLKDEKKITSVMTGLPQWLHGDSYTLVELLDYVIHKVRDYTGVSTFDLEASPGKNGVYIDVIWKGGAIPAGTLDSWLDGKPEHAPGGMTAGDVLEHHRTELWSQSDDTGVARLRLPLPPAQRAPETASNATLPPRPEFYDFSLFDRPALSGNIGKQPLKSLNYVVFDTETTGLNPSGGDEIISIAGVRIVQGRILTGESFTRLVNPGRDIPKKSIRFHGITEEMVANKPPIQVVLPQFRDFIGQSVLVAHNAAFDMKFLKLKEAVSGVKIDNPILDTLLISVFLHDHTPNHTLDDIAERFGVTVEGRHTALGDSLVTASVFLHMLDMLDARNIKTLDDAIAASNRMVEIRARQAAL